MAEALKILVAMALGGVSSLLAFILAELILTLLNRTRRARLFALVRSNGVADTFRLLLSEPSLPTSEPPRSTAARR